MFFYTVGADQTVYQRLNRHSSQTDLGVGDHHASLDDIAPADFHLQTVIDRLEVQTVLRHLAGHDLVIRIIVFRTSMPLQILRLLNFIKRQYL